MRVAPPSKQQLRGPVVERLVWRIELIFLSRRKAEINQSDLVQILLHHDVVRLQVTVNDSLFV